MLTQAKAQNMMKRSELEDKISEISMKLNNAKKMYTSRFFVLKTIVFFLFAFFHPHNLRKHRESSTQRKSNCPKFVLHVGSKAG